MQTENSHAATMKTRSMILWYSSNMETEIKVCNSSFFIFLFLLAALEHKFKRLYRNKRTGKKHKLNIRI